jgi:hypothetical protein
MNDETGTTTGGATDVSDGPEIVARTFEFGSRVIKLFRRLYKSNLRSSLSTTSYYGRVQQWVR